MLLSSDFYSPGWVVLDPELGPASPQNEGLFIADRLGVFAKLIVKSDKEFKPSFD